MSESMRAYCIKWSVAFTTNCQLSGLSICPVQQCSPVPESPYGSPHLLFCSGHCSRAQMMRIFVCTCKIICECQDTRFRLSDWGMSGECICGWSLLQCSNPTYSHLILDDLVVSSVLQRTPRKSYSLALSCSFYYPSLFLQPSSDVASPQPVPSSPWSNINGFVKNPFGCSAPMSAPESTLYTLLHSTTYSYSYCFCGNVLIQFET